MPSVILGTTRAMWRARSSLPLREGRVDLEIGTIDHVDPETRVEELVTLRLSAGIRAGLVRGRFATAIPVTSETASLPPPRARFPDRAAPFQ